MHRYRLTELAELDLDGIIAHIVESNPVAALSVYDQLLAAARKAAQLPLSGASRDDLRPGVRMKVVGNYLLFYLIESSSDEIVVIRVLHGGRDLKPLVANAPTE